MRLDRARSYFPELNDITVKVGIALYADGLADLEGKAVYFRSRNVSDYVLGHELTHLVQEVEGLPKTERSCDIFTMARAFAFCDEEPCYVNLPEAMIDDRRFILGQYRMLVHRTARSAAVLRQTGKRFYISWFEQTLKEAVEEDEDLPYDTPEIMLPPSQANLNDFLV